MQPNDLISLAICLGVAVATWLVLTIVTNRKINGEDRLGQLRHLCPESLVEKPKPVPMLTKRAIPKLALVLRSNDPYVLNAIKSTLSSAGFNHPQAVTVFLAIKTCSIICGILIGSLYSVAAWTMNLNSMLCLSVGAAAGMALPGIVVSLLGKKRRERIFLSLPAVLDLMVICIEVGKGVESTFQEVCELMRERARDVCSEFELMLSQLQVGLPRQDALHQLGVRSGVDDMNSLATVLIQSEQFGSSISQTLRELTDSMRVKRRQLAEERAQKTAVKLLFPLILFIFPGIFVVLVGPAAISVINDYMSL